MTRHVLLAGPPLVLAILLCARGAAAQDAPSREAPLEHTGSNVLAQELPAMLGFVVERSWVSIEQDQRVQRYLTGEKLPDAALRLREWETSGKTFGGGYRFVGWAHQHHGDVWWFTLRTPRSERFIVRLEAGEGGRTVLVFETMDRAGPRVQVRRPYQGKDDLGPPP